MKVDLSHTSPNGHLSKLQGSDLLSEKNGWKPHKMQKASNKMTPMYSPYCEVKTFIRHSLWQFDMKKLFLKCFQSSDGTVVMLFFFFFKDSLSFSTFWDISVEMLWCLFAICFKMRCGRDEPGLRNAGVEWWLHGASLCPNQQVGMAKPN